MAAKIAQGEIVHVDASLIRAAVSWESLAVRRVDAIAEANGDGEAEAEEVRRRSKQTGRFRKVRVTDPDASRATNGRIQAVLTAAAINLKRLAAAPAALLWLRPLPEDAQDRLPDPPTA